MVTESLSVRQLADAAWVHVEAVRHDKRRLLLVKPSRPKLASAVRLRKPLFRTQLRQQSIGFRADRTTLKSRSE